MKTRRGWRSPRPPPRVALSPPPDLPNAAAAGSEEPGGGVQSEALTRFIAEFLGAPPAFEQATANGTVLDVWYNSGGDYEPP